MEKKAVWNIIAAAALWGCIGVFLKLLTAAPEMFDSFS